MRNEINYAQFLMRIIITGGGTGGHLFPGIALATALQQRNPGCRIMFIGTGRPLDRETLTGLDFQQESIACTGLKGMGAARRLRSFASLPAAVLEAWRIIKKFKPDLVFGVGGYVTGPVLLAAKLRGVPTCIHEQNSVPGLANRLIARFADRSFVSIPGEYPFPARRTFVSGNPVRSEILALAAAADKQAKKEDSCKKSGAFTLLVMGGSLGAHRINLLMLDAVERIKTQESLSFRLIHQTGAADEEQVRAAYTAAGVQAEVEAFFNDMAGLYAQADLAIARAGATSLAELSVMGLPALLIPYPHAADDHQAENAKFYVAAGGAKMYRESELDAEQLASAIMTLLNDADKLKLMGAAMRRMSRPNAAEQILDECIKLIIEQAEH